MTHMTDSGSTMQGAPPCADLLAGRTGLVLGVSRRESVGYHCVRDLKAMGASVAFTQRPARASLGVEIARELNVLRVPMDVLEEDSVREAFDVVASQKGQLDFLVHCLVHVPAGSLDRPVFELSKQDFAAAMEVGVRSLLMTTRYALPLLRRSGAPRIVALFSAGGEFAIRNYHLVGIVKGALATAMRYLAMDLGPLGVLCNGVSFPMLETEAAERVLNKDVVAQTRSYQSKRSMTRTPATFESVTNAVGFLVSQNCQNLTGEILNVDGGYCRSYF